MLLNGALAVACTVLLDAFPSYCRCVHKTSRDATLNEVCARTAEKRDERQAESLCALFPVSRPNPIKVLVRLSMPFSPCLCASRIIVAEPNPDVPIIHVSPRHISSLSCMPLHRLDSVNANGLLNKPTAEQLKSETNALGLRIGGTPLGETPAEQVAHQTDKERAHSSLLSGARPDYRRDECEPDEGGNQRYTTTQVDYGEKSERDDNHSDHKLDDDFRS